MTLSLQSSVGLLGAWLLVGCGSGVGAPAPASGGDVGTSTGGTTAVAGTDALGGAASTTTTTAGTSAGGALIGGSGGAPIGCADPVPHGDVTAADPTAETAATPLTEADFKDPGSGATLFHYAISAPKTFASADTTAPAKQLGLFICFHEHFGMAHDEPPSVIESLARLQLSGDFVVIGMGQQDPAVKGYDKVVDHQNAVKLVAWAKQTYPINARRVYLWGRGEGARMAMELGAEHPELFAGLITYSWGSLALPAVDNAALNVPDFYVVNGLDDYVTHPPYVRSVYASLKKLGYSTIYREIPGLGGDTKNPLSNDDAIAWASRLRHKTLPLASAEQAVVAPYADQQVASAVCPDANTFRALIRVGGTQAGQVLPGLLGAQNEPARVMAATSAGFSMFGNEADVALAARLHDASAAVRKATLQALGAAANWRYLPAQAALIEVATDTAWDSAERALAVDSIGVALALQVGGAFQDPPLFQALITLLNDEDRLLRTKAFAILAPSMVESGYQPDAPAAARQPEIAKWQTWLANVIAKADAQ